MRDHRLHDLGVLGKHLCHIEHLGTPVVRAIAERGHHRRLSHEQCVPRQGDRCTGVHPEDHYRAPRRHELDAASQRLLAPRRLDDDVVEPVHPDCCTETLGRLLLMRMAGIDRNVLRSLPTSTGDGQQPQCSRSDHRDSSIWPTASKTKRMPRDRRGFDDRRIA